jgi:hypothetical protein
MEMTTEGANEDGTGRKKMNQITKIEFTFIMKEAPPNKSNVKGKK